MWAKKKQRSANIVTVPAPTKGINDYDSIANMDPTFALDMLNMFPAARALVVRNGYKEWTTGFTKVVRTLMTYGAFSGGDKLFGVTDDGVYNITTTGVLGVLDKALTNGFTDYVNFANVAGNFLISVNGTDLGVYYDGATWTDMSTTVQTTDNCSVVHVYNHRLWFAEKESMTAWYLPVDAISGAMAPFYLGGVFSRGGFLQNIFTWSLDSGDGLDDILIFQSSNGEIVGYAGSDPSTAATFTLQASYFVGPPLGQRSTDDFGGDVAMLVTEGIVPISKVVGGTQAISRDEDTLTKNISRTFSEALIPRGYDPGWEILNIPAMQSLIVNFPTTGGLPAVQVVMNTLTGAWTRYDLPARTMCQFNNTLYFSDENGRVLFIDTNINLDNVSLDESFGQFITSGFQTAWNYFGLTGTNKVYSLIRPLFIGQFYPNISLAVAVDYEPSDIDSLTSPGSGPALADLWDAGTWDSTMWYLPAAPTMADVWDTGIWDTTLWAPPITTQYRWLGVEGMGYCASLTVKLNTNSPTEFAACDWVLTPGLSL